MSLLVSSASRRSAVAQLRRRWPVGDWAMFLAAYFVIIGAVLFAVPEGRQAGVASPAIATTAR